MHPAERIRMATETARAVLDGRLEPAEGARALEVQQDQITDRLRSDRIDVTQIEADTVALTLRRLAEQVSDRASGLPEPGHHLAIARTLGEMAQALR